MPLDELLHRIDADIHHLNPLRQVFNSLHRYRALRLATERFDADLVRQDLQATRAACDRHGCPLEFILKDISTVCYQPQRLSQWGAIAMEVAGA